MSNVTKNETGNSIVMPWPQCLEKRLAIFNNSTDKVKNSKSRKTETACIKIDDITSQHTNILDDVLHKYNIILCDFCYFSCASLLNCSCRLYMAL